MKAISTLEIENKIKELFKEANYDLGENYIENLENQLNKENTPLPKTIIRQLLDNHQIAKTEKIPMCQDTGMAIVFLEIGQNVKLEGKNIYDAVNDGVKNAYDEGYLRKSVVDDPLFNRVNTKDNTPAILHTEIVQGDKVKIIVSPKGFGSENMSAIKMLKPSDGVEGVKSFVLETVKNAGPNPCPPIVVGIGIGGSFEKAAYLAKKSLTREIGERNSDDRYAKLELELLEEINKLNIGPGGFGGKTTALDVKINYFPTHIAALPVAVNICCHAYRHKECVIG